MNDSLNNGLQLKSAMWDAANTLRGSAVDRIDWKAYIPPLLFFKRISDVWDEETAEAGEIYGEADPSHFPGIHRFPSRTHALKEDFTQNFMLGS